MADVALKWNSETQTADIILDGADLAGGDDLASAVTISLFTNRRAQPDDALPDFTNGRRGWWGDGIADFEGDKIGSRLWLLTREKLTNETVARAAEYAREALQWILDDKIASRVDVVAERNGVDRVDLVVSIYRRDGAAKELRFADVWGTLNNA